MSSSTTFTWQILSQKFLLFVGYSRENSPHFITMAIIVLCVQFYGEISMEKITPTNRIRSPIFSLMSFPLIEFCIELIFYRNSATIDLMASFPYWVEGLKTSLELNVREINQSIISRIFKSSPIMRSMNVKYEFCQSKKQFSKKFPRLHLLNQLTIVAKITVEDVFLKYKPTQTYKQKIRQQTGKCKSWDNGTKTGIASCLWDNGKGDVLIQHFEIHDAGDSVSLQTGELLFFDLVIDYYGKMEAVDVTKFFSKRYMEQILQQK
eukprot:293586_1